MATTTTAKATTATRVKHRQDDEDVAYAALLEHTRDALRPDTGPLFTTDAAALFDAFLKALPEGRAQHYDCRNCRHFIERFGGLVTIDEDGDALSPLWDNWAAPRFFRAAVEAMSNIVAKARVTGVYLSSDATWGVSSNASPKSPSGAWHHMHVVPDPAHVHRPGALATSSQVAAEKAQDYGMLCRGLADFPLEQVRQAHTLLTTGALYRSEKCIGVAKWLLELHEVRAATSHRRKRENMTWRAVAVAPPGFCHVRTTMIATLLENIASGMVFDDIKRSFDAKVSPIQYQRPQAAPSDGQLAAAEAAIAKLGTSGALARRFATLEDIRPHAMWTPREKAHAAPGGSVFGHLKSSATPSTIDVPAQVMTWEKFARTVLPDAEAVECRVPSHGPFFAFVTAEDPNAPPILQWDREDSRNAVSWYLYHGGSVSLAWGLQAGAYAEVAAITLQPSSWGAKREHQGDGVYFVLRGARDTLRGQAGLGLFPEILRSEYHGMRAAIEAYSRSKTLSGAADASACGLACQKSAGHWQTEVRVTSKGARASYRLDRWD